jgi:hypothetical protein
MREWLTKALARLRPWQRKALGLGVVASLGLAVFFGFFSTPQDRVAVAAALRDPLSVLGDRSPGARLGGALFQTKQRRAAGQRTRPIAPGVVPHERVLAMTRSRPVPSAGPLGDAVPDLALLGRPEPMFVGPGVPVTGGAPQFDVPGFSFGDGPGFAIVPDGPQPSQPGSPPPNGPGSAVPEIATWLMMILGIGAVGRALRRRRVAAIAP